MLFYVLILAAVGSRFLPHAWNFTPIGAMLLFCGAWMGVKRLWFPLAAIIVSDFLLTGVVWHYAPTVDQYFTWSSYLIYLALGLLLRDRVKVRRVVGSSLLASAGFFLVSNFGVWFAGLLYPRTLPGLAACYVAGLPFAYRIAAGDLFFAAAFFGLYAWARSRQQARAVMA